jgi:coenzyme PQQ precursor peptide PqqA
MEQEGYVSQPCAQQWETPTFEEIRVSAEATAYMGVQEDWD